MAAPINPKGAKSDKEWRAAIMLAVNEVHEGEPGGKKKLRKLAEKLVEEALSGNVVAMKEIGDRLDGKPAQSVAVTGDDGGPIEVADVSNLELARKMAFILAQGMNDMEKPSDG